MPSASHVERLTLVDDENGIDEAVDLHVTITDEGVVFDVYKLDDDQPFRSTYRFWDEILEETR